MFIHFFKNSFVLFVCVCICICARVFNFKKKIWRRVNMNSKNQKSKHQQQQQQPYQSQQQTPIFLPKINVPEEIEKLKRRLCFLEEENKKLNMKIECMEKYKEDRIFKEEKNGMGDWNTKKPLYEIDGNKKCKNEKGVRKFEDLTNAEKEKETDDEGETFFNWESYQNEFSGMDNKKFTYNINV